MGNKIVKILLLIAIIFLSIISNLYCQTTGYTDLDEALKHPNDVYWLSLGNQTKYSYAKELPLRLAECKNLHKIYFGWHKNFDMPKLLKLLSKLPKLDTLQMYACDLKTIPKEIGLLTNLKCLELELNELTEIAPEIKNLKLLEDLNLVSNNLSSLPDEIGDLTNLKQLHLTGNEISILPNSICKLEKLTVLNLTSNNLKALPEDIYKLASLKELAIYGNKLKSIPKTIGLLKLDEIYIGGYQNELKSFPYEIFEINTLKHLGIYDIKIDSFPIAISNMIHLNSIGLRDLKGFDWKDGFEKLSKLPNLKKAEIGCERYGEITREIVLLKSLTDIKITGSANSYQVLKYISELSNLTKFSFEYYADTILPPEIVKLNQLHYLELKNTKLTKLPPEIGQLNKLEEFIVSSNWGQSISIPKEIGQLKNLITLDLSSCHLKELPEEIGNLSNLEELILYSGNLKSLPSTIGKLHNLKVLYLSNNDIEKLPIEIKDLKALKTLIISGNELIEIDSTIEKLAEIEEIDLSDNLKLKTISENIGNLKKLNTINLSNTSITTLPISLSKATSIISIKLCKTLIPNSKELDSLFKNKLEWVWNCRDLESTIVDFNVKYGTITANFKAKGDTLIFTYTYFYDEPQVIDEEYRQIITFKIQKNSLQKNKKFIIPDSTIVLSASFFSIWNGFDYNSIKGQIEVIDILKKSYKLKVNLTAISGINEETRRELVNKTLNFIK